MNGRVGALHIRYQIPASMPQAQEAVPGLDRIARHHLAEACESAFDQVIGNDHAVYVLREVTTKLAILGPSSSPSAPIAAAWGDRVAGAAALVLARGDEGTDFVKFEDQTDFVARFLTDLVRANADNQWFYGAFARYRAFALDEVVVRVLDDNREHLAGILRRLREHGQLERVLKTLTPAKAAYAGRLASATDTEFSAREQWRPLMLTAIKIAKALGADVTLPAHDDFFWYESLAPSLPSRVLPPDWKDTVQLVSHVVRLLECLTASGHLRWPSAPLPMMNATRVKELLVARFDWLPLDHLIPRMLEFGMAAPSVSTTAVAASIPMPTPRQRRFLELLVSLVREEKLGIDPARPQFAYDRLHFRAALAAAEPSCADDPQLLALLDAILIAREEAAGERDVDSSAPAIAEVQRARQIVKALGPSAETLLHTLAQTPHREQLHQGGSYFSTDHGAIFLLTRALIDLRIPGLLKSVGVPSPGAFLAGLAAKLAGEFDGVLCQWAGYESDHPWSELDDFPIDLFREGLFRQSIAQRHVAPNMCFADQLLWRGLPAAAASGANGSSWPLAVLGDKRQLLELWQCYTERAVESEPAVHPFFDALGRLAHPLEACSPEQDLMLTITAACVVRAWGYWLRGVGDSTPVYLIKNTLDRKAVVRWGDRGIEVALDPAPLDSVVELSGYFASIGAVPWLADRAMHFRKKEL